MRSIAEPFVVAPPQGARIHTRLRVSEADERVLAAVGAHLGSLAGGDLAWRCSLGAVEGKQRLWAKRKQALTAESSSRWAGAITRVSEDQWQRERANQFAHAASLRRRVATIDRRLAVPPGRWMDSRSGQLVDPEAYTRRQRRRLVPGYATAHERWCKRRRRDRLAAELARVEADLAAGRVRVCRGGAGLARSRHHLDAAGLSEGEWRRRWEAARWFLQADGEAGKRLGNETIRACPDTGTVEVNLPAPLGHLANAPDGRYRLDAIAEFHHRGGEWADRAAGRRPIAYEVRCIEHRPGRWRWYLHASWQPARCDPPSVDDLLKARHLAVDVNGEHLAGWVVDGCGNPVGPPVTVEVNLEGLPASTRDGRVRAAVTALLDHAKEHGCAAVAIEDLDFAGARQGGRDSDGAAGRRGRRGRRLRRTVAGIPTGQLRARLAGMAFHRGLWVVAVDPAYTSQWGRQHWHQPLAFETSHGGRVSSHHAAAVVIGRRAHRLRARRRPRPDRPPEDRRPASDGQAPPPAGGARKSGAPKAPAPPHRGRKTRRAGWPPPDDQAAQHRSGPPSSP